MSSFHDHPIKKVIREHWCKPLLSHFTQMLGCKLTYLGLPGIMAIDVIAWIDHLKKVIAFDIGDYSSPYNDKAAKENISKLYQTLSNLEKRGQIDTFSLFHGYIEEVVLRGFDRGGIKFDQNDLVTVYNLDFCNSLTVPLNITDPLTGKTTTYYKTEVLRKLLQIQTELAKVNSGSKFIIYLTLHSHFLQSEAEKLFSGYNNSFYKKYDASISHLDQQYKNIRLLRYYILETVKTLLCANQFTPEFLPTIYYHGTGRNWLLCFTIIGTYVQNPSSIAPFNQSIEDLVQEKFLQANKKTIEYFVQGKLPEADCNINPVDAVKKLKSYQEIWMKPN